MIKAIVRRVSVIAISTLLISSNCFAQSEIPKSQARYVRCPNAIFVYESEDKETVEEILIPDKKMVRCANIRKKKLKKIFADRPDTLGSFELTLAPEFTLEGQAQAYSPAFKIRSKPAILEYSSTVSKLTIELLDLNTYKVVDKLVNTKGNVSGTTYLNRPGHFVLKISGTPIDGEGDWAIDVYPTDLVLRHK